MGGVNDTHKKAGDIPEIPLPGRIKLDPPLPKGWEFGIGADGIPFFVNKHLKKRTTKDPRGLPPKKVKIDPPLSPGWEIWPDKDGVPVFYNHKLSTSCYTNPKAVFRNNKRDLKTFMWEKSVSAPDIRTNSEKLIEKQKQEESKVEESFDITRQKSFLERRLAEKDVQERNLRDDVRQLRQEVRDIQIELDSSKRIHEGREETLELEVRRLQQTVSLLEAERDDLMARLGEEASAKLTDNNPQVVDLSNEDRPTKIAEKFSELYDNQWTDAYEKLMNTGNVNEKEAIGHLLSVLMNVYEQCFEAMKQQLGTTKEVLSHFMNTEEVDVVLKKMIQRRKLNVRLSRQAPVVVVTSFVNKAVERNKNILLRSVPGRYLESAIELCWLMCIQDPPVVISATEFQGTQFNKDLFRSYTADGEMIDFVVWPVMYLQEGGPILLKGVAQAAIASKTDSAQTTYVHKSREPTRVSPIGQEIQMPSEMKELEKDEVPSQESQPAKMSPRSASTLIQVTGYKNVPDHANHDGHVRSESIPIPVSTEDDRGVNKTHGGSFKTVINAGTLTSVQGNELTAQDRNGSVGQSQVVKNSFDAFTYGIPTETPNGYLEPDLSSVFYEEKMTKF